MKTKKQLLVVTPTLGRSPYLAETIESVARYAGGAKHVLVGPAEARGIVDGVHGRAIYQCERPGTRSLYDAVNQVVELHGTECSAITYINDDDRLEEGFALLRQTWREASAGIVFGRVNLIDAQGVRIGGIPVARYRWQVAELMAAGRMPLGQQGTIIDMGLWGKMGGFSAQFRLCADMDLLARACRVASSQYVPTVVASFRLHGAQLSKNVQLMQRETAEIAKAQGGQNWRGRVAYALLIAQNMGLYAARVRRTGWVRSWKIVENEK